MTVSAKNRSLPRRFRSGHSTRPDEIATLHPLQYTAAGPSSDVKPSRCESNRQPQPGQVSRTRGIFMAALRNLVLAARETAGSSTLRQAARGITGFGDGADRG